MTNDTIILTPINQVFFEVTCTHEQAYELRSWFESYVPNFKFNPKYKAKMWSGKISQYNIIDRKLPIGLLYGVKQFCEQFGYKYIVDCSPSFLYNLYTDEEYKLIKDEFLKDCKFELRDYQEDVIKKLILKKRGIIEFATGSGKSLIIYSIIRYLMKKTDKKILQIVPSISLVQQLASDFNNYGWPNFFNDCGLIFSNSDNYDLSKKIIISTWQSLQNKPASFFKDFGAVLVDETHGAKALEVKKILEKCTDAEYRYGFTGTLPEEKLDLYTIFGLLGPKVAEKKSTELMKEGVLSPVKIINCLLKYPDNMIVKSKADYMEEVDKTINYPNRNRALKYILRNINSKHNFLILANRIEHIKQITDYLKMNFPDRIVESIWGETDAGERERIRLLMDKSEGMIIVGSFAIMATGINIPRLHDVILASSYKQKIKIVQSIGRSLRKSEGKSKSIIWDLVDDLTWKKKKGGLGMNYLYQHFLERKKHYKEQGFPHQTIELFLDKLDE